MQDPTDYPSPMAFRALAPPTSGRSAAAGPAARPCLIWAIGDENENESAGPAAFTVGETYLVPFAGDQLRNGASLSHPVAANYFGLDQRRYTCKRGGLRLPAPRPHQPQMHLRAHAAARKSPRLFCGFCGNPHAAASPGLGRIFELYAARGTCWFAG